MTSHHIIPSLAPVAGDASSLRPGLFFLKRAVGTRCDLGSHGAQVVGPECEGGADASSLMKT